MTIDVEQYRSHLERLLGNLGEGEWTLMTVPSVEKWAQSVGRPLRRVFVPALAARASDGRRLVVVRRLLTDEIQSNVRYGFVMRGQDEEDLQDPMRFLEHLILHEVAHHVLDTEDEAPCDGWAFARLPPRTIS